MQYLYATAFLELVVKNPADDTPAEIKTLNRCADVVVRKPHTHVHHRAVGKA